MAERGTTALVVSPARLAVGLSRGSPTWAVTWLKSTRKAGGSPATAWGRSSHVEARHRCASPGRRMATQVLGLREPRAGTVHVTLREAETWAASSWGTLPGPCVAAPHPP